MSLWHRALFFMQGIKRRIHIGVKRNSRNSRFNHSEKLIGNVRISDFDWPAWYIGPVVLKNCFVSNVMSPLNYSSISFDRSVVNSVHKAQKIYTDNLVILPSASNIGGQPQKEMKEFICVSNIYPHITQLTLVKFYFPGN